MKPCVCILLAGCLWSIPVLHAQQLRIEPIERRHTQPLARKAHETLRLYFGGFQPEWTNTQWLREEVDPMLRARRAIRQRMQAQSLKTDAAATAAPRDPVIRTNRLQILLGNNTDGNWSPYPDRKLDARTLRFPMRRDARADKRSDQRKALDKIRGRE